MSVNYDLAAKLSKLKELRASHANNIKENSGVCV